MPQTIDEVKFRDPQRLSFDVSQPTNQAVGIPMKHIPHMDFPMVVYKHPREPFRQIEHRNVQHEVVHIETVPAEHLTKAVNDKKELEQAMKAGWVKEPYIAQAPPDPNDDLYASAEK